MAIRRITAWIDFDPPVEQEEAIQALGEAVLDDGAELSFDEAVSATGSQPEDGNGPKTEGDLLTLMADIEHGIEQARDVDPAAEPRWTLQIIELRTKVKTLYKALQDEAFPVGAETRQTFRGRLDVAAKTLLREFFNLSDEQAESIIHPESQ